MGVLWGMKELAMIVAAAAVYIAALSGMLHVFPRLGAWEGRSADGSAAPGLDLLVSALT